MLKSFFFVPANSLKFIEKSKDLLANYIVFDLEDAVLSNELDICYKNLALFKPQTNHFVRFRFFENNTLLNEKDFKSFLEIGFKHFIIPKFEGIGQAKSIRAFLQRQKISQDVFFILLLENPLGLLSLFQTLTNNIIKVTGIGLGSHDYCNAMGMKHTSSNLYFARQMVLNHAKAFNMDAIDTVSVNIEADVEFQNESIDAFNMGFNGKFLIHPRQLKLLNEVKYYSNTEIEEAEKVFEKIKEIKDQKTAVVSFNGKVFEKPHIDRIINIINWKNSYGSK
jgi:citrate lyase beta subunit